MIANGYKLLLGVNLLYKIKVFNYKMFLVDKLIVPENIEIDNIRFKIKGVEIQTTIGRPLFHSLRNRQKK